MSVLVFSHGCPNNVPGIIWGDTDTWKGIFPNRVVPEHLLDSVFSQASLKVGPITDGDNTEVEGSALRNNVLRLLTLLRRRIRGIKRLADILDLTDTECVDLLDNCRQHKLIDFSDALTDFGRMELRRENRQAILKLAQAADSRPFYVPMQLREPKVRV